MSKPIKTKLITNREVLRRGACFAANALIKWLDDPNVPWPQRVECAMELVRQGYGRAPQVTSDDAVAGTFALKVYITPLAQAEELHEIKPAKAIPVNYRRLPVSIGAQDQEE